MIGNILFDISHLRFEGIGIADVNAGIAFITNKDSKRSEFYTENFVKTYGQNETRFTPESVFAFSVVELSDTDNKIDEEIKLKFEEAMSERLHLVEAFLTFLWFVRDNSIGLWSTIGQVPSKRIVNKIAKSVSFYNCSGAKENTVFTPEELEWVGNLTIEYQKICPQPLKSMSEMLFTYEFDQHNAPFRTYLQRYPKDFKYNEQNCLLRTMHFLMLARNQTILIYKIGYYIAALECLFTTNSSEITKTLAYRIAFYLGGTPESCEKTFRIIVDAYDIRSKFLHGQKFKNEHEFSELKKTSKFLDDTLRRVLVKVVTMDADIFTIFGNVEREDYLNSLIFFLPFDRDAAKSESERKEMDRQSAATKKLEAQRKTDEHEQRKKNK